MAVLNVLVMCPYGVFSDILHKNKFWFFPPYRNKQEYRCLSINSTISASCSISGIGGSGFGLNNLYAILPDKFFTSSPALFSCKIHLAQVEISVFITPFIFPLVKLCGNMKIIFIVLISTCANFNGFIHCNSCKFYHENKSFAVHFRSGILRLIHN